MNATISTSKKPVRRGFSSLPCILCGNTDGNVTVSLDDVSQFHCNECGDDFDADAVRQQIAQWQAVLAWIDAAPTVS